MIHKISALPKNKKQPMKAAPEKDNSRHNARRGQITKNKKPGHLGRVLCFITVRLRV
jgi:hypothetical protein